MKKKLSYITAGVVLLAMTSCSETWDDNPKIDGHKGVIEADFLNAPVMQDLPVMFTQDNEEGSLNLTCSQPYLGYAAFVTYKVQCSLTEDFVDYREIDQAFYDCGQINPLNKDLVAAIEYLSGVVNEGDLPLENVKLWVRLRAYIEQSPENTQYLSNPVYFSSVGANYLAIWVANQPANIYLRGGWTSDWAAEESYQFFTGEQENTWYTNTVSIAKGIEFKVADAEWGAINLGKGEDTIMPNEIYKLASGGNNITMGADFTGKANLTKSGDSYTLILVEE